MYTIYIYIYTYSYYKYINTYIYILIIYIYIYIRIHIFFPRDADQGCALFSAFHFGAASFGPLGDLWPLRRGP